MNLNKVLTFDIECYKNYFLVMFKKLTTGEVLYFEKFNDSELNRRNIYHILNKYTLVSFNGIKYDMLILEAALAGFNNITLKKISDEIIQENKQPWMIRKDYGLAALDVDHIDVMEVAPLSASLKLYAGRLHAKKMQDLPIDPNAILTDEQRKELIPYCENDNDETALLKRRLIKELELRETMSEEIGVDLRSKSDAQIAEAVIKHHLQKDYGITPYRPDNVPKAIRYRPPSNIKFRTKKMKKIFEIIKSSRFTLQSNGHVQLPEELKNFKFNLGYSTYKIGAGGLHSCEKKTAHIAKREILVDVDVESFYPRIILNNDLFPKHIGEAFLKIYGSIVERRVNAKRKGIKTIADSLKITINGSFGKFASKYSFLYSPQLMLQVTLTGQLSLLMLIEELELNKISVVSGNTDGIVLKMLPHQKSLADDIIFDWELKTDYVMEETEYTGLYSRDVNNYLAVTKNGKVKAKGAYADNRDKDGVFNLHVNPANEISSYAVKQFLLKGTPIKDTIMNCNDITKFVTVRTVTGGAGEHCTIVPPPKHSSQIELLEMAEFEKRDGKWFKPNSKAKNGMTENAAYKDACKRMSVKKVTGYIGKAIRWYYGEFADEPLYYMKSGNKVPRSEGAVPLMELPDEFPDDVNYEWYVNEAESILEEIGYYANY